MTLLTWIAGLKKRAALTGFHLLPPVQTSWCNTGDDWTHNTLWKCHLFLIVFTWNVHTSPAHTLVCICSSICSCFCDAFETLFVCLYVFAHISLLPTRQINEGIYFYKSCTQKGSKRVCLPWQPPPHPAASLPASDREHRELREQTREHIHANLIGDFCGKIFFVHASLEISCSYCILDQVNI